MYKQGDLNDMWVVAKQTNLTFDLVRGTRCGEGSQGGMHAGRSLAWGVPAFSLAPQGHPGSVRGMRNVALRSDGFVCLQWAWAAMRM